MKKPYKHFDLPTQHLAGEQHYVPSRARNAEEIERRRMRPRGALVAEQQWRGLEIAGYMLAAQEDTKTAAFIGRLLAASALNSAWYGFAARSDVMRRRLHLPLVPVATLEDHTASASSLEQATQHTKDAATASKGLVRAIEAQTPYRHQGKEHVGRTVGNAALSIACLPLGDYPVFETSFVAQQAARQYSLEALQDARALQHDLGTSPSLAQLADPDSDLSLYIRREAPDAIYAAFEEATDLYRIPR